jgi:hypothetical protein
LNKKDLFEDKKGSLQLLCTSPSFMDFGALKKFNAIISTPVNSKERFTEVKNHKIRYPLYPAFPLKFMIADTLKFSSL